MLSNGSGEFSGTSIVVIPALIRYVAFQAWTTDDDNATDNVGVWRGIAKLDTVEDVIGGVNNDVLGGAGGVNNTLTEGDGADNFVFNTGYGADTVTDFQDGLDMIDLQGNANVTTYLADVTVVSTATETTITTTGGDTIVLDGVTGGIDGERLPDLSLL